MQSTIFAVNNEPYCLWEADLPERNRRFLEGLDPEFFNYILSVHTEATDEQRALVALRLALHHATESMFSLLGAFVQAPDCAYAWIAKCSNDKLREFARRVSQEDVGIITKLQITSVSWKTIAEAVFAAYQPGTERQAATVKCFAALWGRLSGELTDEALIDEYNALKHGFRLRPGGFGLAVGVQQSYGVSAPASEMKTIAHSKFGASFLTIEKLGSGRGPHIRSRKTSVNWSMERVILLLQLVHMSINNVVSALKIANSFQPDTCEFVRPENDTDFERPWAYSTGLTSMNIDFVLDEERLPTVTKADLLSKLRGEK